MKTLKTLAVLISLLCCSFYSKAQFFCGVNAEFIQHLNPNMVATFTDTSSVSTPWQIVSYHWDFGDGTTSGLQNPTHVYTTTGTFTVCEIVTAYNSPNFCSDTFCRTITINNNACSSLHASFTISGNG